jgi:hypothetical protein
MNPVAILFGAFVLVLTVELLRRRTLREKYAAIWLVVSLTVIVFAVVPAAMTTAARLLGFALPSNLLFLLGGLILTSISVHLSLEMGRLEDQTQRLAEEVALLRLDVVRLTEESVGRSPVPFPAPVPAPPYEDGMGMAELIPDVDGPTGLPTEPPVGTPDYIRTE